jgi:molybdopterin converting factor small subunit
VLSSLLARSAVAVNNEFAEEEERLPRDAEIALLPPVSGGSCPWAQR